MALDDNEFVHMAPWRGASCGIGKGCQSQAQKSRNPAAKDKSFQGNRGKIIRLFKVALKGLHLQRIFV